MRTVRSLLGVLIMAMQCALAHAQSVPERSDRTLAEDAPVPHRVWQGEWTTALGPMRLVVEGRRVFGDLGADTRIEGRTSRDGRRMRGTFDRRSAGTTRSWGTLSLALEGHSRFSGLLGRRGLPSARSPRIDGRRMTAGRPALRVAEEGSMNWPPARLLTTEPYRRFVQFRPPPEPREARRPPSWTGVWRTDFGRLRVRQAGRRVWGELRERGLVIEARTLQDGRLRGTLSRPAGQEKAKGGPLWGTFELRPGSADTFKGAFALGAVLVGDGGPGWNGARVAAEPPALALARGRDRYWPVRFGGRPSSAVAAFLHDRPVRRVEEQRSVAVRLRQAGQPRRRPYGLSSPAGPALRAGERHTVRRCVPALDAAAWRGTGEAGRREMLRTRWCVLEGVDGYVDGTGMWPSRGR